MNMSVQLTGADIFQPHFERAEKTAENILNMADLMKPNVKGYDCLIGAVRIDDRPIAVRVFFEDGHWLSEQEWLNVIGHGEKPLEALKDAEESIRYLANYYAGLSDNDVIGPAVELKARYSRITLG